jgi:GxxExxY protein
VTRTISPRRRGDAEKAGQKVNYERGSGRGTKLIYENLTEQIIGAAIEVHKGVGPGLLESVYQKCMCHELKLRGLQYRREVIVPVVYKGIALDCGYRLDMIVEETVILELKSTARIIPVHEAQLLTYLKLLNKPVGFIINFNVPILRAGGIVRKVFDSASQRLRGESPTESTDNGLSDFDQRD